MNNVLAGVNSIGRLGSARRPVKRSRSAAKLQLTLRQDGWRGSGHTNHADEGELES